MDLTNWLIIIVLLIIILDIVFRFRQTDYPLLQKALNQNNDYGLSIQLKALMADRTPYAQIGTDEFGVILMWNGRAEETFGWKQQEMLGKNIDLIIPQEFRAMHNIGVKRWRETGKSKIIDNEVGVQLVGLHRLGSQFPIHLKLISINDKGYKLLGAYIRNISTDIKERDTLIKDLKFCKSVLNTAKIGGFNWNIDTNKVIFDENTAKIYNVSMDEMNKLLAPDLIDLIYPKDQARVSIIMSNAIENKLDSYEIHYRRLQLDGSLKWIFSKGCTVIDENELVSEINGIVEDLGPANPIDEQYKEHIHYG